jgi:hypothetical protein
MSMFISDIPMPLFHPASIIEESPIKLISSRPVDENIW